VPTPRNHFCCSTCLLPYHLVQSAVPRVEQQEVLVPVAQQDASFARRLGEFVLQAVETLTAALGLAGQQARGERRGPCVRMGGRSDAMVRA